MISDGDGDNHQSPKKKTVGKSKRRSSEEEREHAFQMKLYFASRIFDIMILMVKFTGFCGIGYVFIVLPLKITAGKETFVQIAYRAVLDLKLSMIVPWADAALFAGAWSRERSLRKKTVQRMNRLNKDLESQNDMSQASVTINRVPEKTEEKT